MGQTLGTMITMTTYGTWLRGDKRGWVEKGLTLPPDPELEAMDRRRMKHEPFLFPDSQLLRIGQMIGESLQARMRADLLAMTVQRWHCHFVIGPTEHDVAEVVKCAKDAARYGLRAGRPIWTDGYDKRFCFDENALRARIEYVERHNLERGLPLRPWRFIVEPVW